MLVGHALEGMMTRRIAVAEKHANPPKTTYYLQVLTLGLILLVPLRHPVIHSAKQDSSACKIEPQDVYGLGKRSCRLLRSAYVVYTIWFTADKAPLLRSRVANILASCYPLNLAANIGGPTKQGTIPTRYRIPAKDGVAKAVHVSR